MESWRLPEPIQKRLGPHRGSGVHCPMRIERWKQGRVVMDQEDQHDRPQQSTHMGPTPVPISLA
jgi:hypothetical protein